VVGDPTYGGVVKKLLSLESGQRSLGKALLGELQRQALHACELSFDHPISGEPLHFTSPLPADIDRRSLC
jgi:23S rRNA pseudouridine1911/1915/1917 synthase